MAKGSKTHSGAKKRFKKLKSGLFTGSRAGRRHLLTKKNAKRKRGLRKTICLSPKKRLEALLPF